MLRDNHDVEVRYLSFHNDLVAKFISLNTLKRFVFEQPERPDLLINPVNRQLRRDIHNAINREVRRVQRQRRQRQDESEGGRPTTPNSAFSMSLPNTPQLTPRTRRRAVIRDRNPIESPRRRLNHNFVASVTDRRV
jgi:hypothetical protein